MSLVFAFLFAINQVKDLILNGACDFQTKLVGKNGIGLLWLDKTKRINFTVSKPKEDKD